MYMYGVLVFMRFNLKGYNDLYTIRTVIRMGEQMIQQNSQYNLGLGGYPNMYSTSRIKRRAPVGKEQTYVLE